MNGADYENLLKTQEAAASAAKSSEQLLREILKRLDSFESRLNELDRRTSGSIRYGRPGDER